MEISVGIHEGETPSARRHYCTVLHRTVSIETEGVRVDAPLFCPLCGARTTTADPDVRGGDMDRMPHLGGPRCAHGFPDATCASIADADPGAEWTFRTNVPEYRAFLSARKSQPDPVLARWARPCAACRRAFLAANATVIEYELRLLCRSLARDAQAARDALEAIQSDTNLAFALLREASDAQAGDQSVTRASGYVYAITDGRAIKIGWSAHHGELRVIGAYAADPIDELRVHRVFSEHRIRGEWFRYVPAIVEYFRSE